MIKNITIIGGSVAAWLAAVVFTKKKYHVNIFEGDSNSFGSQQISPNGWLALNQICNIEHVEPIFEPFNTIHIKKINSEQTLEFLTNYDLINKVSNYGSISREDIVEIFKTQALKSKRVKIYSSKIDHIVANGWNKELLDSEGRLFESDFIIGADGVNGISRKFVVGSKKNIGFKKIFRAVSLDNSPYQLTKRTLQILIHSEGYYVIYPTIIKKKKATNYIFVPNKNNTTPPKFLNSTLLYLIPNELHWISTHVQKNLREKTSIYKQGTFLFGDAAFPTLPHLAQGGNQILEDAVFLKNFLEHSDNLDELVNSFIRARYLKRDLISKKSELIGKVLSSNNLTGHIRNLAIQSNGKDLIDNFLNPIWTS